MTKCRTEQQKWAWDIGEVIFQKSRLNGLYPVSADWCTNKFLGSYGATFRKTHRRCQTPIELHGVAHASARNTHPGSSDHDPTHISDR